MQLIPQPKSSLRKQQPAVDRDPAPPQETRGWFIWSLHLVLGLVVGVVPGLYIWTHLLLRIDPASLHTAWTLPCGTALLGGCLASLLGNRLWHQPSMWMDEEPRPSWGERLVSQLIGAVGAELVLDALVFGVTWIPHAAGSSSGKSLPKALLPVPIGFGAVFLWLVLASLREGEIVGAGGKMNREDSPVEFWAFIALGSGVVITAILAALRILLR